MAYWPPCYSDDVCRSDIFPKVGRCAGRRYYRLDTGLFGLRGQRSPKRCLSDRYRGAVDGGPWLGSAARGPRSELLQRSEERRVGKECRSRRAGDGGKKSEGQKVTAGEGW